MIKSLLIANRGEIAVRIARTCKRLGIRTIAVFSEVDRHARHVCEADDAYCIGPAPARESYLRVDAIMAAAQRSGAAAIHPGYGFLSEKPQLAEACAQAGIVFVGPAAACIAAMGPKIGAKILAAKAGVASVPGYSGEDQSDHRLQEEARTTGFPLMVKASAGGGGRGMRIVTSEAELVPALDLARREAEAAFGDPALLIEKLVQRPRHLEVQIAGDKHGNVIHLFERDCSVQRNNQKVLEEAPAPNLPAGVRQKLLERAVKLARGIGYDNLGTVEFILEAGQDEPWFLEMNTRLQVEHPVTEAITGLDLVEWQIRIAAGEPLPLRQEDIRAQGHAIEARVTAERADQGFRSDVGTIIDHHEALGARTDSGIAAGSAVTMYYDSMLAKVIAHADTREAACARLAAALRETVIAGVATTLPFLIDALEHPLFATGQATTRFIEQAFPGGWTPRYGYVRLARAAAAILAVQNAAPSRGPGPWANLKGFRVLAPSGGMATCRVLATTDALATPLTIECLGDGQYRVIDAAGPLPLSIDARGAMVEVTSEERVVAMRVSLRGAQVEIAIAGERHRFDIKTEIDSAKGGAASARSGNVIGAMPGIVTEIRVREGERVEQGQVVAVLESMKLFMTLNAEVAGVVRHIACKPGQAVQAGERIVEIEPAP